MCSRPSHGGNLPSGFFSFFADRGLGASSSPLASKPLLPCMGGDDVGRRPLSGSAVSSTTTLHLSRGQGCDRFTSSSAGGAPASLEKFGTSMMHSDCILARCVSEMSMVGIGAHAGCVPLAALIAFRRPSGLYALRWFAAGAVVDLDRAWGNVALASELPRRSWPGAVAQRGGGFSGSGGTISCLIMSMRCCRNCSWASAPCSSRVLMLGARCGISSRAGIM
mmetsp:Transcript_100692/g.260062  ORF Transcript_100692/g.260062 Transcript_100692/m.260062 type:complete len:222 (-) Transcript_100692:1879-2544(-)